MLLRSCLTVMLSTALLACGGGSSTSTDPGDPALLPTLHAVGQVVDDQGVPLADATVTVVSASAVPGTDAATRTDADGRFALKLDAATPAVLKVQKTGYASSFRAAAATSDNAAVADRVVLLPVASTQSFDPTQAAVLRVPGSPARVELAPGSLVREDGQTLAAGDVLVALTPIDPSADIGQMPGLLVDAASGDPIESLGAMSIEFTDASGAPLNLASGQTALIRIPATPAAGASLPDTFPLYHLNETTGRWVQEGTATLQTDLATGARYYEGTVSHFSWWNADQVMDRANLNLGATLNGATCTVPAGLRVVSRGVDYNGTAQAVGNDLFVRASARAQVWLVDETGRVLDTLELDSGAVGSTTALPRCLSEPPLVRLSGRVTLTNGALSNYLVQIGGERVRTVATRIGDDGRYSTQVYSGSGAVQARLLGAFDRGTPDTAVSTTVGDSDAAFPDLAVNDTRFELAVCVQGWAQYRQSSVQVSLFRGDTLLQAPRTLFSSSPSVLFTGVPLNSTLTLRLTAPDATLAEKTTTLVVGNAPATLGACLDLPVAPQPLLQVNGGNLTRLFDASASVAGDAPITRYQWDFGDGQSAEGVTASHTYPAPGSYPLRLTLTDALGQLSSVSMPVIVASGGGTAPVAGRQIDSGELHTCSITAAGGVSCFGYDGYGQLGGGELFSEPQPVAVVGLSSGVTEVAAGGDFSCALTSAGAVKCWGYNGGGELGHGGTETYSATPVDVQGLGSGVVVISAGSSHACAVTEAGAVKCWGRNDQGQLGTGNTTASAVPVAVSGLTSGVTAVSAGSLGTCALVDGAGVFCWGNYGSGASLTPVALPGLGSGVVSLSLGDGHGCAVTSGGAVRCWGQNTFGQLGDGTNTDNGVVDVLGLGSGVVAVSAGPDFSCALSGSGQAYCWGHNDQGQLGDGGTISRNTPVGATEQNGTATGVSTRDYASCVLLSDRTTQCWGWLQTYAPGG